MADAKISLDVNTTTSISYPPMPPNEGATKPTLREVVDVCDRWGILPTNVTVTGWAEPINLEFNIPGVNFRVTAKTIDELDNRLRLLAPAVAESALQKR